MYITEFFNNDFSNFATYDAYRSIASFIDGFKPTQRKLICTADNYKIKEPMKLSSFVNKMIDSMEYLHGPTSAEGAAVNLAQNFTGSNNINLLKPSGSFGTRTVPTAAASRYIKTCKESVFDKIFIKEDKNILIDQYFEGTKIEPRFYIPILPMILVNGSEGIGTGFAQKILSRNPKELVAYIKDSLNNKQKVNHIMPYFEGFKGKIKQNIEQCNSYEIYGVFERLNSTTILITELPISYTKKQYNNILSKLEDDKIILDFKDKSVKNNFCFELKVTREFSKKTDEWIYDKLKLIKRITENFTCIGENNEIVEFKNEIEILDAFIEIRKKYYVKRKEFIISKLNEEYNIAMAKWQFIKAILDDKLIINKKSKSEIDSQILNLPYFKSVEFKSRDFLLNMPIHSLSNETYKELDKQIKQKSEELENIKKIKFYDMWLDDLKINL